MADEETGIPYVPGEGDIPIELYGLGKVYLKPTLSACLLLSRSGDDGPRRLADKCLALNIDAISIIVAAGLDKDPDEMLEVIFKTGLTNLFGPCLQFIRVVMNGGRLPKEREDKDKPGDPPKSS